jgi:hypothetical protein
MSRLPASRTPESALRHTTMTYAPVFIYDHKADMHKHRPPPCTEVFNPKYPDKDFKLRYTVRGARTPTHPPAGVWARASHRAGGREGGRDVKSKTAPQQHVWVAPRRQGCRSQGKTPLLQQVQREGKTPAGASSQLVSFRRQVGKPCYMHGAASVAPAVQGETRISVRVMQRQ